MKETEPCPLNGKDLVGECIVDELFDNGEFVHYHKENKFLGLINETPATVEYVFGGSVMVVHPLHQLAEGRKEVLLAVKDYVNRFCMEEKCRKAGAKLGVGKDYYTMIIKFFYYE
jgi:hypothetical protein